MQKEEKGEGLNFLIGADEAGARLDKFIARKLRETISRNQIQKLIQRRQILINGRPAKPHYNLKRSDEIEVSLPAPRSFRIEPEPLPLDIIYEDEDIVVVDKPEGLTVHPSGDNVAGTLVNALLHHCKKLSRLGGEQRPGIVHRLDKDTSGLMVVAKTDRAYTDLQRQFAQRRVKKVYIALVEGALEQDEGDIDAPIARSAYDRKKMAVRYAGSKSALTRYKVLARRNDATLLEIRLATGRTHQIRVHMAHIGHPVLGDAKYGTKVGFARMMLHSKTLGFTHPVSGKYMEFESAKELFNFAN